MTRIIHTVEVVSISDIKAGDVLLDGDGERIVVQTITNCAPHRLRYQDSEGAHRTVLLDCVLRVVSDEPTEEKPQEWPDAPLIRIIRGTENTIRVDGSLATPDDDGEYWLLTGPRKYAKVMKGIEGDSIKEWEEVVPVSKAALTAALGTPAQDDDVDDVEDAVETVEATLDDLLRNLLAAAQREEKRLSEEGLA